jgi:hypothetical protein
MPTQKKYFVALKKKLIVWKESLMEKKYEEEDLEGDETGLKLDQKLVMMKNLV